jgi:putative Holliday junction resolvase
MPPNNQSVIALDYGEKRIGVAIASSVARLARPLTTLANDEHLMTSLKDLINNENVGQIVVGYPRGLDGQETNQTRVVDQFVSSLGALELPVQTQDESLTSVHAETELNKRKKDYSKADIDALAATYILEDYLEVQER